MSDTIRLGGTTVRVVVAEEPVTVLEVGLDPGSGAPPHVHTLEDETMVVLEGGIVVDAREPQRLSAGEARFLARGVRHSFANDGQERARFVCTPGGLERFFREVAGATGAVAAAERVGLRFG